MEIFKLQPHFTIANMIMHREASDGNPTSNFKDITSRAFSLFKAGHIQYVVHKAYAEITIHFGVIHVDSVYFEYTDCFTMISGCARKSQARCLAFSLLFCCCHNYNVSNCYVIWWVKSFGLGSLVSLTRNSNKFAIYIIYVYCKAYICIVRYLTTCVLSGEMCDCLFVYSVFNCRNGPMINIVNAGFCYSQCCCNRLSGYRAVWTHFK